MTNEPIPRANLTEPRADVQLVVMPYADIVRPSLAVGLLHGALKRDHISCRSVYANIRFANLLGPSVPDPSHLKRMLGEWSFSKAAFRDQAPTDALPEGIYRNDFLTADATESVEFRNTMLTIRNELAPAFVDDLAREILSQNPKVVGCSSTFEQHCASLALLRRIKELAPEVVTLLGGANCESEMGLQTVNSFPWVDFTVSGEADEIIAPLCRLIFTHGREIPSDQLPVGVLRREDNPLFLAGKPIPRSVVDSMDSVAVPHFADYFTELEEYQFGESLRPGLMIEMSRGCWWGQKHPCTFCGLNGGGMSFRAKSPERALSELKELASEYGLNRFMVVDNILDQAYLRTVLPVLADEGAPYELFFETKANLKHTHVKTLKDSGVKWIQPGIESFSNDLLKLMDKGASGLHNIQLLKYTREQGIYTTWLLLHSFPHEDDNVHFEVANFIPLLTHLQPPKSTSVILFDRFSVYHKSPDKYGLNLEPDPDYLSVYPISAEELNNLCYYFVDLNREPMKPGALALTQQAFVWHQLFERHTRPVLTVEVTDKGTEIFDTRPVASQRRHLLTGLREEVYTLCEPAVSTETLKRKLKYDESLISATLESLVEDRLILEMDGKFLALAVPGSIPPVCQLEDFPGGSEVKRPPYTSGLIQAYHERLQLQLQSSQALSEERASLPSQVR